MNAYVCAELQKYKLGKHQKLFIPSQPDILPTPPQVPMILDDVRNWLQSTLGTCSVFVCLEYSPLSGTQEPATPRCSSNTRVLS